MVPNYGVCLQSKDEAKRDVYSWRKFRSANYDSGSKAPYLAVTYESRGAESDAASGSSCREQPGVQ